ncbi:Nuclear transcription factor Y subunit C-2 [Heracleum sosnowskyi]|uniref:Nuclear transcription factor Y subunit C-2 n=1 Tax=Heracleum sosnowskyi TaxID=360622 RepID=A0AAD8MC10_9APIA|nr:Nuclear transcription factor Y subunit C-2 [Heracleum sosnowskyi]
MDQSQQSQQQQHVSNGAGQISNAQAPFVPTSSLGIPVSMPTYSRGASTSQNQLAEHQQQRIESFWADQMAEAERATDFKNHMLPLARVKKIMKADEDVRMISSEAPVVFAKACEMFISELTLRSWMHTEESKRKTLQKNDIAAAISKTETFDFLVDILPRDELREESHGPSTEPIPYYYLPQQQNQQQLQQQMAFVPWHHQLQPQQQHHQQHQNHQQHQENNDRV